MKRLQLQRMATHVNSKSIMKQDKRTDWITVGYELFAMKGEAGLVIEPLAKKVGKNKSSFYHYFADQETFLDELLQYHLSQVKVMCAKERTATSFNPDIIAILIEHKTDILFNKQLRINHHHEKYRKVVEMTEEGMAEIYTFLLKHDVKLNLRQKGIESFFQLALTNFFLAIHAENFTAEWLADYFNDIERLAKNFEQV